MTLEQKLQMLPIIIPALILSATLHELAHAYVARWLGDLTAAAQGRLTLNPLKHLDPLGSAMFLITFLFFPFAFGYAKPVPVYPSNFRHPQRDMALVAIAGPVMNFLIALVLYTCLFKFGLFDASPDWLIRSMKTAIVINLVLSLFNLLPIPPLDGSRIVGAFMPKQMYEHWSELDRYAAVFLLALFIFFQGPVTTLINSGLDLGIDVLEAITGAAPILYAITGAAPLL